ncbi:MAG TPA: DUF4303 domain-containing protein [Planctomycetaceae bacterium]|jgi:hypothetical protein|nr:DUF4303 domain-containing protein [Planctomycetaceae bacterium]
MDELKGYLVTAARLAWQAFRAEHPSETFYAFSLDMYPLGSSVAAKANTEERLKKSVEDYLKRWQPTSPPERLEEVIEDFRWHSGDWSYCNLALLETANKWLQNHGDHSAENGRRVGNCCMDVLRALDNEGLFGKGKERAKMYITLSWGDLSLNEILDRAKVLNPPAVYERCRRHMIAGYEAWRATYKERMLALLATLPPRPPELGPFDIEPPEIDLSAHLRPAQEQE